MRKQCPTTWIVLPQTEIQIATVAMLTFQILKNKTRFEIQVWGILQRIL